MRIIAIKLAAVLFLTTSCASAHPAVTTGAGATTTVSAPTQPGAMPASALDTARIRLLAAGTAPAEPLQITFDWVFQDRDFKFQGRGIVRMQGPDHGRLDLFALQDIQVLRASLNGDSLALVYSGPHVPIPPTPFLWAVLDVFRAPAPGIPATLKTDGTAFDFSYDLPGGHWRFRADSTTLRSVEWQGDDGGRRTVELSGPYRFHRPSRAVFRDWREFRELTLTVTAVEKVEPFAPEIWNVSNF